MICSLTGLYKLFLYSFLICYSSTSRAELRERLAVCSQQLSPSPPSLALYTVLSPPSNRWTL